jgi:hypothetical protein
MYDMMTSYKSYIVPAGKYWLGDPCYIIKDQDWLHFCNEHSFNETEFNSCVALSDGTPVLAFSTYYGDGCYSDQHGNSYPVDAGLIGLVPWEYTEKFTEKFTDPASGHRGKHSSVAWKEPVYEHPGPGGESGN